MSRTRTCIDCGASIEARPTGAPPKRCGPCREERARAVAREKSRRWRASNPERAREAWTRSNERRRRDVVVLRPEGRGRLQDVEEQRIMRQALNGQGGRCAICAERPPEPERDLRVDVDPCRNRPSVLCVPCYTIVRLVGQDEPVRRLLSIARYLTE